MPGLNAGPERFWEIDSLRGIAITMMIVSNLVTDISYFGISGINIYSGFWLYFARLVVSMFLFLVGLSLTLSYSKVRHLRAGEIRMKYLMRGLKIFGWGLIITFVTLVFLGDDFILFGVLHFIGVAIILSHLLLRYRFLNLLLGILLISAGIFLQGISFDFYWLFWLGLRPTGFFSVDYVPLLPWLGVVLLGLFSGNLLYPEGKRRFALHDLSGNPIIKPLRFLGRNSLLIYLIHQPLLIVLLWLLFPLPLGLPL
jgi:uncharacterized membrane protein